MRKIELTYRGLFLNSKLDQNKLSHEVEKAVEVNCEEIINSGAYRHRIDSDEKPATLVVTVEIVEG